VGHPALADPVFALAVGEVLMAEALTLAGDLLDGRLRPAERRSPFFAVPFLRTNFWPALMGAGGALVLLSAWWLFH